MNTEIINIIPRTKETIIAEVKATIEHVESTALLGAIRIGRCFEELKELIPHGGWYEYIEENTGYTPKKVERFMKIAGEYGNENTTLGSLFSKTTLMSDLSYTKALSLLTLPDEEVETFVENHDIKDMTVKELEAEIKALKEERAASQEEIEKLGDELVANEHDKLMYRDQLEEYEKKVADLEKAKEEMEGMAASGNQEELEAKEQEIQKLRADLEKNKEAQSKLKDKIAQSEADTQKKIEEALEKTEWETARKIDKARQEAREAVDKELDEARANIERLSKELAATGNEDILKIKIKAEQFQAVFAEIKETIGNLEEERQEKMTAFLKTILRSFLENLEV